MPNLYEITFDTKKGCPKSWILHIEAGTAKEAKEKAALMWSSDSRLNDMHMFHVNVRPLNETEEFLWHYFAICGEAVR